MQRHMILNFWEKKIKKRVKEKTGIDLEWEIRRIGDGPKVEL